MEEGALRRRGKGGLPMQIGSPFSLKKRWPCSILLAFSSLARSAS